MPGRAAWVRSGHLPPDHPEPHPAADGGGDQDVDVGRLLRRLDRLTARHPDRATRS
ncbi:hypothetical protein ACFYNO_33225 [Kitasatospora sp. NPDC006697]|uniref:hypothetical protein n=1 Tax=Kitasatospora sp. NPDC006697 TaxID=3364020 RepID=UPI003678A2B2